MPLLSAQDIMEKNVISVRPETPLIEAAKILAEHKFDGVPAVDQENHLVGIITEYDLVSKGSAIHLPTFQMILQNLCVFKKDQAAFAKEVGEIASLIVKDVMNTDPLTLRPDATYEEAVAAFRDHHRVNPIPVIDGDRKVIGVISRFDVLKPLHALALSSATQK